MTNHPFPAISNPQTTTTGQYSGDVIINLRNLVTDIDLSPLFESWRPIIKTQFLFRSGKIAMSDPDLTNEISIAVADFDDIDGNFVFTIPAVTEDDTFALLNTPQIFDSKVLTNSALGSDFSIEGFTLNEIGALKIKDKNDNNVPLLGISGTAPNTHFDFLSGYKTSVFANISSATDLTTTFGYDSEIDKYEWYFGTTPRLQLTNTELKIMTDTVNFDTATITNLVLAKSNLPTSTVYTDQVNTFGSGQLQTFRSNYFAWYDINASHRYTIQTGDLTGNIILNIPVMTANDTFAFLGLQNVFTDLQKIQISGGYPLTLYRTTTTAGLDVGIQFNEQNSNNNEINYAVIAGGITDNTAGAQSGQLKFQTRLAGSLATALTVSPFGDIIVGRNQRVTLSESGQTSSHTFTFPNISGAIVTNNSTTEFTNKTFNADGTGNSITNIENADIKSGANIDWAKINKTGSILDDLGDVTITSGAAYDILYRNSGNTAWVNLPKGTNNRFLGIDGSGALAYNFVSNANIIAHTSTQISITNKAQLNSAILYNDTDNLLGAHYLEIDEIAQPTNPAAGKLRIWADSTTHMLSQVNSSGVVTKMDDGTGGGGGSGDVTGGSNLGAGIGVFKQENASHILEFKTLNNGSIVTVAANGDGNTIDLGIANTSITNAMLAGSIATSKLIDGSNIAMKNVANIFTDDQKIEANQDALLELYRPSGGIGDKIGIDFSAQNESTTEVLYARMMASIQENTAGAQSGIFYLQLVEDGTLKTRFMLHNNGNLFLGANQRLVLSESGLSAQRIFTFPDQSGQLALAGSLGSVDDLTDADTTTVAPVTNDVLTWDGTNWVPAAPPGASGGEANTYSTVGTGGAWTMTKTGVNLPFKSFIVGSDLDLVSNANDLTLNLGTNVLTASNEITVTNKTIDTITNLVKNLGQGKYTIFKDGSTYYCRNNWTGAIDSSNSDATVVLQYAIDNAGGHFILVKAGTYPLSQQLVFADKSFVMVGEGGKCSGMVPTNGDTVLQANYTDSVGYLIDCHNTGYVRQQVFDLVIDCNNTVANGVDAFDIRERFPFFARVAIIRGTGEGLLLNKAVYTSMYDVTIMDFDTYGLHIPEASGTFSINTTYFYGGKIINNGTNVYIEDGKDWGFYSTVLENGVINCVKHESGVKQGRYRDCSFEWHPTTTTNIAVDEGGTNIIYDGCRFDSNNTTYYPITIRSTARHIKLDRSMFQANNSSTTANITIESGAQNISLVENMQDTNTPLTVTVTDNANSLFLGNSFVQDKVPSGLQMGTNKLWLKEVDANTLGLYASDGTTRRNLLLNSVATSVLRSTGSSDMITFNAGPSISFNSRAITDLILNTDTITIKHSTTNSAGDLLKGTGTKYDRLARGTNNQVLVSSSTDVLWATLTSAHLPSTIAYENEANIFTAAQKIQADTGQLMTFYRPVNTAGFGAGFYYNFDDSLNIEHTYGFQYISIEDNVEATLRGDFNVQLAINNVLGLRFRVYTSGSGGIIVGNNQYLNLSQAGLTAARTITFPDADTLVVGDTDSRLSDARTPLTHTHAVTDLSPTGTALQVVRTNSAGNGVEWASLDSERTGKAVGDGGSTEYIIPHGLGSTPSYAFIDCSTHSTGRTWEVDNTNITVTFDSALSGSTDAVNIYWRVIA